MIIPLHLWRARQRYFTEDEKAEIVKAVCGETDWPRGELIDETLITPDLAAKLRFHFVTGERRDPLPMRAVS